MKIAIDISPLSSGHKVRGVGFYVTNLKRSLLSLPSEHEFIFFTRSDTLPQDIDVVHYPYFEPFFLSLPLYKKYKTVVTVHDLIPLVFPQHFPAGLRGKAKWLIQRSALQSVQGVIADSQASKNDIVRLAGVGEEKVTVIYLAADDLYMKSEKHTTAIHKKYALPEAFALYVGDTTWNKNLVNLVQAIKSIDIPLVMVGKALTETVDTFNPWNESQRKVQSLIRDDKRFITLGFIPTEDVKALYNAATVAIFPSFYEGFGLPVIEAMACGTPVVTTKEGSLKEVAGDNAHIVDPYNVQEIAAGIKKVFTDKKLQKKLSAAGVVQAKKFSWEQTAQQTLKVYEKVAFGQR